MLITLVRAVVPVDISSGHGVSDGNRVRRFGGRGPCPVDHGKSHQRQTKTWSLCSLYAGSKYACVGFEPENSSINLPIVSSLVANTAGEMAITSEQKVYDLVLKQAALVKKQLSSTAPLDAKPEMALPGSLTVLKEAYDRCGEVCAEYAKTFYLGTLLMTPERRRAIWAIYGEIKPRILVVTWLIPEAKGTKCNQELEAVFNTEHSHILRVPFKTESGVVKQWVSRFDIYPYLERYAQDSAAKIIDHLEGKPDLIIGNYTDGNLVASLVASKLGVTQGTIAHALEKTKYEDSDIKWKELDQKYHFSCQFTADVMSMNTTDFIITKIIIEGVSGFQIDPNNGAEASNKIADFFEKCKEDPSYWNKISTGGLQRIYECYTWKIYANKVLNMGSIYGFWKHMNKEEKLAKQRYLQLFYNLQFRNLAKTVPIQHDQAQQQTQVKPLARAPTQPNQRRTQSRIQRFFGQ